MGVTCLLEPEFICHALPPPVVGIKLLQGFQLHKPAQVLDCSSRHFQPRRLADTLQCSCLHH